MVAPDDRLLPKAHWIIAHAREASARVLRNRRRRVVRSFGTLCAGWDVVRRVGVSELVQQILHGSLGKRRYSCSRLLMLAWIDSLALFEACSLRAEPTAVKPRFRRNRGTGMVVECWTPTRDRERVGGTEILMSRTGRRAACLGPPRST